MSIEKEDIIVELRELLEKGCKSNLTVEQENELINIAKFFIAMRTIGKPGAFVLKITGYFVAMVIGWTAFKSGFGDIIRGFING